jgi:hypothetical protein
VIKLCQGCLDKNVGSVAAPFQPKIVEYALERVKWLQHSNQAIFGGDILYEHAYGYCLKH